MDSLGFCKAIQRAFSEHEVCQSEANQYFLNELNKLTDESIDEPTKMTQASILFEGFYRHLDDGELKTRLIIVRTQRWEHHFGTPTVPFLLSYKSHIDKTKQLFDEFSVKSTSEVPWHVQKEARFALDGDNGVIVDPHSISRVVVPPHREMVGLFTKTHNPFGGFTTAPCDLVSQRFIEHAAATAKHGGKVLEIGAAFGAATLEALANGATVFCNDIDPENLAVVRKRHLESGSESDAITGDDNKLVLVPGALPQELLGLPEKFFDAILICRVLHFFTGSKIEESLLLLSKLLTPGGKIYIVCETPYLKNWQRFLPEFQSRVDRNVEWPGEITNPAEYESSGRAATLPKFVHWITKEVLERCLVKSGLDVEHAEYINRAGQFPDDLLSPEHGKESVGAIGITRRL